MTLAETVKVYPDIALGMLRQGETATGRIWLLLRHLDQEGRGWLRIDIIKHHLTHKTSKHRVCGWRQLRKLLNRGEGVFWTRDSARAQGSGPRKSSRPGPGQNLATLRGQSRGGSRGRAPDGQTGGHAL